MRRVTSRLREEHRAVEERLDTLLTAIDCGVGIGESLRAASQWARAHYRREMPFLDRLALYEPAVARKLTAQHEEALELSAQFEEALAAGQERDMLALARRYHAIAQHNIIEEERDVFPLADRCFTRPEHEELIAELLSAEDFPG